MYFPSSALSDRGIDGALSHIPADQPVDKPFSSIPATFWFMIVTLMTVGYGDMVPTTVTGRLIAVVSMILSMLVLALPMSVVGTNFAQVRGDCAWRRLLLSASHLAVVHPWWTGCLRQFSRCWHVVEAAVRPVLGWWLARTPAHGGLCGKRRVSVLRAQGGNCDQPG